MTPFPADVRCALLVGDLHSDEAWLTGPVRQAIAHAHPDVVVQHGDLNWFPHIGYGQRFLATLQNVIAETGVPWLFIDGNHDNHAWLRDVGAAGRYTLQHRDDIGGLGYGWDREPGTGEGPFEVCTGVLYLPRGWSWSWADKTFVAVGGGYSVDYASRVADQGVWPQYEGLTPGDIERCLTLPGGAADVVLSHDAPDWSTVDGPHFQFKRQIPESEAHRHSVGVVTRHLEPSIVVHGHYHQRYSRSHRQRWGPCLVHGLGKNGDAGNLLMLDVETGRVALL